MSGTITHKWNGTVLTVTSDSGTSSMDLKGSQGDMGVRGPQGAPGVLVDTSGTILAPANNYYLKEEVDDAIAKSKKDVSEDITTLQESVESDILELQNTASAHSKRIANLEHTLAPTFFETDDSVAYVKDVPEIALPYAEINEVGGMTYRSVNLLDMSRLDNLTTNGVTFTKKADGTYTANGTATASITYYLCGMYCNNTEKMWLSGGASGIQITTNALQDDSFVKNIGTVQGSTFQLAQGYAYNKLEFYLIISNGVTLSNVTFYGMLNVGSTALPYQPYFTGLRDSKVTAIETTGANILPAEVAYTWGCNCTVESDGKFSLTRVGDSGVAFFDTKPIYLKAGKEYTVNIIRSNVENAFIVQDGKEVTSDDVIYNRLVYTSTESGNYYVRTYMMNGATNGTTGYAYIWITAGDTTFEYSPYVAHTFPIPEAVQALDGYGLGINKNYHNKVVIDPDNFIKKYVKTVGKVDLGNVSWTKSNNKEVYCGATAIGKKWTSIVGVSSFDVTGVYSTYASHTGEVIGLINDGTVYVKSPKFVDKTLDEIKAYLKGTILVYELATPTETDISDIVPDDNFIRVYGAGIVTAVNEHKNNVPTKITYQFKEATT